MSSFKDTLNMPKTAFDMRANLAIKEPIYRKKWLEMDLYQKVLDLNKNNPHFVLHDGPPYANGKIHVGTALNKILKDIVVRSKSMQGFYSPYIPGWDTHGLPIENKVLKEKAKSHEDLGVLELRKMARDYALSQIELQKSQFIKLQMLSDFKKFYATLDPKFEASQLRLFHKMVKMGLVFKTLKPIYWSPTSQTALAEGEIEYGDHVSPSIYISLDLVETSEDIPHDTKLIIWTTTPWTLLANAAVAISSTIKYCLIKTNNVHYIIAKSKLDEITNLAKWKDVEIVKDISESALTKCKYRRPFDQIVAPIVIGHHVNDESGTGLVHIAPLFGADDFVIGKKHKLEQIMHIDDKGKVFDSSFVEVNGMFYEKANSLICDNLAKRNMLIFHTSFSHKYPFDWRTGKPVIFRGTNQWFVSIEKLKGQLRKSLEVVDFHPKWAKSRLEKMIDDRGDWCISRQRKWGVPITIFYDAQNKPILEDDIFEHVIKQVEEYGSDIWYQKSAGELLPTKYQNKGFKKEEDIMDVWFDSGSTNVFKLDESINPPYEMYLEGSDQYRGWFNSSLIVSVIQRNSAPYKQLLSHGFVVDEKSEKMSKSKGNVIDPEKIISDFGAEILRLWTANADFTNDISISKLIIDQTAEYYRRIRNTIKFMLGNLYDFDPGVNQVELVGVHLLINELTKKNINEMIKAYEDFEFQKIVKGVNAFFINLSSFYFEIAKDSLYTHFSNSTIRRMYQTNIYFILKNILVLLAPILPTTCEEAYENFSLSNKLESIHLERLPKHFEVKTNYESQWKEFFDFKDIVYREVEELKKNKVISRSNEILLSPGVISPFLQTLDLQTLLMVGKVEKSNDFSIKTFDSQKCSRCWNHFYKSEIQNDLCTNCFEVLELQKP